MQILSITEGAIRTLLYLTLRGSEGRVAGEEICRTQDISSAFLIKITRPLIQKGIVSAVRGVGGGFRLERPPERLSLLEVVEIMQGPMVFNECLLSPGTCQRDAFCPVHPVWKEIREGTQRILAGWTFSDLARTARARGTPDAPPAARD